MSERRVCSRRSSSYPANTFKKCELARFCCFFHNNPTLSQSYSVAFLLFILIDTPSITAKLINEQKEDKEKKNHEEKEKMKTDNGFQDNYSVVVASGE